MGNEHDTRGLLQISVYINKKNENSNNKREMNMIEVVNLSSLQVNI
jgi:hypothetical protein